MNNKVIKLTESDLLRIVKKVISEQGTVGTNFQQGVQSGTASGQQARQAVNQYANNVKQAANKQINNVKQAATVAFKGTKQIAIKLGKTYFYALITGPVVVFLIAKKIFKVGQATFNAIIKFLSSAYGATVSQATALSQEAQNGLQAGLQAAGIALDKGYQYASQQMSKLQDSTVSVIKWVINQFKQFGPAAWAKILVAASQINEFSQVLGNWLGQQWGTIQNQIGVAWNQAASWASGAFNKIKQGVSNAVNTVKTGVQNVANKVSNVAGNAWGAVKGFFNEMFERYLSFQGTNIFEIISEATRYNGKSIL